MFISSEMTFKNCKLTTNWDAHELLKTHMNYSRINWLKWQTWSIIHSLEIDHARVNHKNKGLEGLIKLQRATGSSWYKQVSRYSAIKMAFSSLKSSWQIWTLIQKLKTKLWIVGLSSGMPVGFAYFLEVSGFEVLAVHIQKFSIELSSLNSTC